MACVCTKAFFSSNLTSDTKILIDYVLQQSLSEHARDSFLGGVDDSVRVAESRVVVLLEPGTCTPQTVKISRFKKYFTNPLHLNSKH